VFKIAADLGQLQALMEMGLVPPESLAELGLVANLAGNPDATMGLTAGPVPPPFTLPAAPDPDTPMPPHHPVLNFLRKIGPLAGAAGGLTLGLTGHGAGATKAERALRGFLSGAGLGSIPNVLASGFEALGPSEQH